MKPVSRLLTLLILLQATTLSSNDGRRIAVLELQHHSADPGLTGKLADRIREGLAKQGESVVAPREISARLDATSGGSEPLQSVVERARRHYYSLRFEAARSLLDNTVSRVEAGELTAEDLSHLVSAYVLQGTVYYDQEPKALAAFEEAARLDPGLQLSEAAYSPRSRTLFQKASQRLLERHEPPGGIEISTTPIGAELWLDGRRVGRGPIKLEVSRGRHYLAVRQERYRDKVRVIEVPATDVIHIQVALEKFEEKPVQVAADPQDRSVVEWEAENIGRRLAVSRVLLVHASPAGRGYQATVQEVDLKERRQLSEKRVEFRGGENGFGKAVQQLIAALTRTDEPKQVVQGSRPLWKRPVFWIVGGLVLAGAGAGMAIGLGGSGGETSTVSINAPLPGVTLK